VAFVVRTPDHRSASRHEPRIYSDRVIEALLLFAVPCFLVVILPGPDSLVVLRGLIRDGAAGGARTAAGVVLGIVVWVAAAVLGLSALLHASEIGYDVLKAVGAAYLIWMGAHSLLAIRHGALASAELGSETRRGLGGAGFMSGFLTDVLNPKVGVTFVTFMPGFIPDGAPIGWTSLALGLEFAVFSAIYFAALIALSGTVARWMSTPRIRRRLDAMTGLVLVGFGVRPATEA